jgi:hypothetical protein
MAFKTIALERQGLEGLRDVSTGGARGGLGPG